MRRRKPLETARRRSTSSTANRPSEQLKRYGLEVRTATRTVEDVTIDPTFFTDV